MGGGGFLCPRPRGMVMREIFGRGACGSWQIGVSVLVLLTAAVTTGGLVLAAAPEGVAAYPVHRVSPFFVSGTSVQIIPAEEYRRQFPSVIARLYGVVLLPQTDPYRSALQEAVTRLNYHRAVSAQIWSDRVGKIARLHGYVDGTWRDLNALLVREGAAAAAGEGESAPYMRDQAAAREARIGRYAYQGAIAAFWANSTPLYAATLIPSPGVALPFAVARVNISRIEAGYLTPRGVVLLPMAGAKLQYYLVDVRSHGRELSITTRGLAGGTPQTLRWLWDGSVYQLFGKQ